MDDVQFLLNNSTQASHLALIDSAQRDTAHWPTASQFDVTFDTPFQKVYGIDLLSVDVPRTEYLISSSRNVLIFSYGSPSSGSQQHVVTVPEGDYDQSSVLVALNAALAQFPSVNGNVITVASSTPVASLSNRLTFSCQDVFTLYLSASSARLVLGFANPVTSDSTLYAAPGWSPGAPDTITTVLSPLAAAATLQVYVNVAPQTSASTLPITAYKSVQQSFTSTYTGICTQVSAVFGSTGKAPTDDIFWTIKDTLGNLCSQGYIQPDLDNFGTFSTGAYQSASATLVAGQTYVLSLQDPSNADVSNCITVGYTSTIEDSISLMCGTQTISGSVSATLMVRASTNTVSAPGLLDLTGERYIVLRCLEIEAAINGSRAFEQFNAGIGLIQLGNYGYSQQAYDYTAYPPRTFQPISALSKMTLSFRKSDGSLYDFKGLNLELLILIRYLLPKVPPPTAQLMPHYTPYLPQMQSQMLQTQIQNDPRYFWCATNDTQQQSLYDSRMHHHAPSAR